MKLWRSVISMELGSCIPRFLSFWGVITSLRRCEDWRVIEDWSSYLRKEQKEWRSVLGKKSKINDYLLLQVSLVRSKFEVNSARKARNGREDDYEEEEAAMVLDMGHRIDHLQVSGHIFFSKRQLNFSPGSRYSCHQSPSLWAHSSLSSHKLSIGTMFQ